MVKMYIAYGLVAPRAEEVFAKFFQNKFSDWQCVEGAVEGALEVAFTWLLNLHYVASRC